MSAEDATNAPPNGAYAAVSDVGRTRDHNEDYAYAGPLPGAEEWLLLMVADGVGGHGHGEWASQRAIENVAIALAAHLAEGDPGAALARTMEETGRLIFDQAQAVYGGPGPATTLVAALVKGDSAWWGNIGDSRIYLLRRGVGGVDGAGGAEAVQLSDDHSWVADQVRAGLMSADEAEGHPRRNIITRTVGFEPDVRADSGGPIQLATHDCLLLCSDGLHGQVSPATMAHVAGELDPQIAATRLVELANESGGPDNITVVLYRANGGDAPSPVVTLRTESLPAPDQTPTLRRPRRRPWLRWAGAMLVSAAVAGSIAAALLWWLA